MSQAHRHHPEDPEGAQLAEMLGTGPHASAAAPAEGAVIRHCRDCGAPFTVPADKAHKNNKWYSLCGGCLRWEC